MPISKEELSLLNNRERKLVQWNYDTISMGYDDLKRILQLLPDRIHTNTELFAVCKKLKLL